MNAAQVRAKARTAMKRREDEVEQEEIEGGEINLIPYLDIVTNLMLFLLASVTAGFILGQIDTTLPDHTPAGQVTTPQPDKKPDEQPLQLVVSLTKSEALLWSISGLEGTLLQPKARVPRSPGSQGSADPVPHYDYRKLNDAVHEIAARRWKGKQRLEDTYEIVLQAEPETPYETIIEVMDNVRCRLPADGSKTSCSLPPEELPTAKEAAQRFRPAKSAYDPDKHPLFDRVLFSLGFE
jgi:biopolymer transport protein ExbD